MGGWIELEQGDSAAAKEWPLRYSRTAPADLAGRRRCRDLSRNCIAKGLYGPRRSLLRRLGHHGSRNQSATSLGLVYVSAFAPDEGESLGDLYARAAAPGVAHVRPDDAGFLWIDPESFDEAFAQDVDPVQARIMAVVQKPIAARIFSDKVTRPAWELKPSWYLVSEIDRMIPAETQRFMSRRMGATVVSVHGEPLVDGFASRQSRKAYLGRGQRCRINRSFLLRFHPLISKASDIGQKPSAD